MKIPLLGLRQRIETQSLCRWGVASEFLDSLRDYIEGSRCCTSPGYVIDVMWCYLISCHVMSCNIMWCDMRVLWSVSMCVYVYGFMSVSYTSTLILTSSCNLKPGGVFEAFRLRKSGNWKSSWISRELRCNVFKCAIKSGTWALFKGGMTYASEGRVRCKPKEALEGKTPTMSSICMCCVCV